MTKLQLTLVSVGTALALAGCGHFNATQPSTTAAQGLKAQGVKRSESFLPTDPKFVWNYEVTVHPTDDPDADIVGSQTVSIMSNRRANGRNLMQLCMTDSFSSEPTYPVFEESAEGLNLKGVTYWGVVPDKAESLSIPYLRFPLAIGGKWDDGLFIGRTKAKERVTVPAGTFEAWKIDTIGTYDQAYTAVGNYWFAPGVGVVKSELAIQNYTFETVLVPASRKIRTHGSLKLTRRSTR